MLTIKEQVETIQLVIKDAHDLLDKIRKECPHDNATGTYNGNTGNWCEADDYYWVVVDCPDCGECKRHYSHFDNGDRNPMYYKDWRKP